MELGWPFLQAIYGYVLTDETEKVYRTQPVHLSDIVRSRLLLEFFEIDV